MWGGEMKLKLLALAALMVLAACEGSYGMGAGGEVSYGARSESRY